MGAVAASLMLALGQLADGRVVRLLAKTVLITLAIFVLFGGALLFGLYRWLVSLGVAFSAELSALAALLLTILAGWLLFRIVALAVINFFADEVVLAVEARHYPAAAAEARDLPLGEQVSTSLRAAMRALLVNLAVLPFALLLLFTAVGPALLFWLVNAVLIGRELQDMVWLRHRRSATDPAPIRASERFLLGGATTALLALPVVNLVAPILGAAAATHLIHRASGRA